MSQICNKQANSDNSIQVAISKLALVKKCFLLIGLDKPSKEHGLGGLEQSLWGSRLDQRILPGRRTEEMVRQIIRHRFLDPDASAEVIAQKLQQAHHLISIRSVERVISDFGLQKKTLRLSP
jgi:hypothetical protein